MHGKKIKKWHNIVIYVVWNQWEWKWTPVGELFHFSELIMGPAPTNNDSLPVN